MADPTGTIGAAVRSSAETDFGLIFKGGADLAARLQQLADARAEHEKALAQLNLGKAAQAALAEAQANVADTKEKNKTARAAVTKAQQRADAIIVEANQKAADVAKASLDAKKQSDADAERVRNEADAYSTSVRKDAEAARKTVDDRIARCRAVEDAAAAERDRLKAATDKANKAAAAADAKAQALQDKIDRLTAAIRSVT